jgi:4-aminobutyrate aminotransferase-like enzyme/Ser/Thr protein kinase RdoA (MazF antagonist)
MSGAGLDFFAHGALPAPRVSLDEAARLAREHFGLQAHAESLGSQQDQNFLLRGDDGEPLAVLKLANRAISLVEVQAQVLAAARLAERLPEYRVATALPGPEGEPLVASLATAEGPLVAHVVRYLPGRTLARCGYLSPRVMAALGTLAARVSTALAGFAHPGLERVLQWDLRHGDRALAVLLEHVPDATLRERLQSAGEAAWQQLEQLADELPLQPGHFDLTDENVLSTMPHGVPLPDGVIDLGDLSLSWRVGELATLLASLLHHPGAEPHTLLEAVGAFHRLAPLDAVEARALWPLVVVRAAVLTVSSHQQVAIDGEHTHAWEGLDRESEIFRRATAVPVTVMTGLVREVLGLGAGAPRLPAAARALTAAAKPATLELEIESELMDEGLWLEPDATERLVAQALTRADAVALPYGVVQLTRARPLASVSPATVPTVTDVWFAHDTVLRAPWEGELSWHGDSLSLDGGELVLRLSGVTRSDAGLALAAAGARVRLQLVAAGHEVPAHVRPEYAPGWLALCADPGQLVGLEPHAARPAGRAGQLLAQRERTLAAVQEHYYSRPPQIERGWREHLIATDGRVYLDMVNNVTILGHAHPRIAAAVSRQLRRSNTNSRFHYAAITELSQRLVALVPEPLDSVFFVNSGSEAVDLALRLALAATGRADIVAMREAYHGWSYLSDAVSTSVADNPNALATRPAWVHTVEAANAFRGRHRGADAHRYAPEAVAIIDALAATGRAPAAFIAEAFYGNAGGLELPEGYLQQVYAAVRRHGGLAVADEVQVGYGRLGEWFWGFEQQGVVPDVVAVAKAMGNGHPLGAVITSRELAERYRVGGYFFSSTGGSPVSSVVGLTVLDVLEQEALQENARVTGAHLRAGLQALAQRHELIGAVHGAGLYLGLEFVRDRATLEPATEETAAICDRLLELGVIMQPTGDHQNVLKIKPPLCVPAASADFFVAMLDEVLSSGF